MQTLRGRGSLPSPGQKTHRFRWVDVENTAPGDIAAIHVLAVTHRHTKHIKSVVGRDDRPRITRGPGSAYVVSTAANLTFHHGDFYSPTQLWMARCYSSSRIYPASANRERCRSGRRHGTIPGTGPADCGLDICRVLKTGVYRRTRPVFSRPHTPAALVVGTALSSTRLLLADVVWGQTLQHPAVHSPAGMSYSLATVWAGCMARKEAPPTSPAEALL